MCRRPWRHCFPRFAPGGRRSSRRGACRADLVDALRKTGVFTLSVPRAIGGREATPVDLMQAIETVATADGSAGWCTMVGLGNNIAAGYMDERGAKEVFADPDRSDSRDRGAGRRGGARRRRRARERPLAVCERHHALRLGVGRMPGHGERPAAHDADGPGDRARLHADWRGRAPRHVARERAVRHRQQRLQRDRRVRARPPDLRASRSVRPPDGAAVPDAAARAVRLSARVGEPGHRPRARSTSLSALAQTKVPTLYTTVLADKTVPQLGAGARRSRARRRAIVPVRRGGRHLAIGLGGPRADQAAARDGPASPPSRRPRPARR